MSYEDEVGKRADQLAADEWDDWGKIAQKWAENAIQGEGTQRAADLAATVYLVALTGESVAAELDAMRDRFIEETSDSYYADAEQQIREEQQDAADALKEEYYDRLKEEAREAGIRG